MLAEGVVDIVWCGRRAASRRWPAARARHWRADAQLERGVAVAAGATLPIDFESEGECVLCYRFETAAQDIGLRVVALASSSRGVVTGPPMLSLRAVARGRAPLPPGKFRAELTMRLLIKAVGA